MELLCWNFYAYCWVNLICRVWMKMEGIDTAKPKGSMEMCRCEYLVAKTNQLVTCYGLQYISPVTLFCKKDLLIRNTQSWSVMSRFTLLPQTTVHSFTIVSVKSRCIVSVRKLFISSIEKLIVDCPRMLSHCSQPVVTVLDCKPLFWSRHLLLVLCVEKPGLERCEYVVAVMQMVVKQ